MLHDDSSSPDAILCSRSQSCTAHQALESSKTTNSFSVSNAPVHPGHGFLPSSLGLDEFAGVLQDANRLRLILPVSIEG